MNTDKNSSEVGNHPIVKSETPKCRCGSDLIETSNGHYVCGYVHDVESKKQEAPNDAAAKEKTQVEPKPICKCICHQYGINIIHDRPCCQLTYQK